MSEKVREGEKEGGKRGGERGGKESDGDSGRQIDIEIAKLSFFSGSLHDVLY